MSYLMYLKTSNVLLEVTGQMAEPSEMIGLIGTGQAEILGIQCVDMSVFGGIVNQVMESCGNQKTLQEAIQKQPERSAVLNHPCQCGNCLSSARRCCSSSMQ